MEIQNEIVLSLSEIQNIDKILLFGSRARGDYRERSDIDLAIWCPNASDADWNSILEIIENANTLLKIDCVRLDSMTESNPLRQKIESEGRVIYTKV
ncbi:MAG: nucleotidyltransferase domain-containing protein [Chlamydiales bacterium]|nr:nucleotidyltransferase domain-containing protein [Chlamydiales bacterium]